MAQQDIVGGLFGMTPESYQQGLARRDSATNLTAAQLTPGQLAGFYAMEAGTGLGRAAQGLLGVEDPQLNMIRDVQQMRLQFDTSSAPGLRAFARSLAEKGYTDFAIQAATKADAMAKALLDQSKTAEETRILGRKEIEVGVDGNPEMVQKVLVDKDGNLIKTLGAPYSRFSSKTDIKVEAGDKNVLDIDKEDAKNLVKVRTAAEKSIPLLEGQLKSVKKGMIQGTFSDARAVFANSMASLGIKNKEILDLLTSTETFKANRIGLASAVAKELGVNPTDRDFQASLDRFASGTMQPEVAEAFINDLLTLSKENLKNANDGLNYYRKNKGSFADYTRPLPTFPGTTDPLQNMSLKELKELEKKLTPKGN
jgi:hypothetical protein